MKYKIGDRVRIKSLDWYNENKDEGGYIWFDNAVFVGGQSLYCGCELTICLVTDDSYHVIENDYYWTDDMIEGLVEEPVLSAPNITEGIFIHEKDMKWTTEYLLPEGYIFKDENGNVINATKIVLEKKKKEYPKTYEECRRIMDIDTGFLLTSYDLDFWKRHLLTSLQKLLICRDAYWKIAGEEMRLGKPWEPTHKDSVFSIGRIHGQIITECHLGECVTLEFPTAEMRDAFYENFKEEIEICKELL